MGALVACGDCGFITRRHSRIGIGGKCPHCERELEPVSFSAARRLQLRKQRELSRARVPFSSPGGEETRVSS